MPDGTYQRPDLPGDAAGVIARIFSFLQSKMPGWEPGAGPGTWHLEAVALASTAAVAALNRWSEYAFARLGALDGAPLRQGAPAQATSTWTFVTDALFTIRRGTPVRLITADGEIELVVVADVLKPAGQLSTAPGEVLLESLDVGAQLNDLSGTLILDEPIGEVDTLALVGLTSAAADSEDLDAYLTRLTQRRRLSTPRPVRADEFAVFVLEQPDVGRVTILDLYNPETEATDARGTTTVFVATAAGEPLLDGRKEQIRGDLLDIVEANYDAFVEDHTYTTVNVTAAGRALPGYDPAVVAGRLEDAIRAHLYPGLFGIPRAGDLAFAASPQPTVGYLNLASDAGLAEGLDRLTALAIGAAGDPLAAADVDLDGVAPLPRPGTITVTVT